MIGFQNLILLSLKMKTLLFLPGLYSFMMPFFYSKKVNGQWTTPVNMTPQLGVDQDYFSSSLSGDGKNAYPLSY